MKKIELKTSCKQMLADVFTPVGMYLRLRDRFRDTILLESTDFHAAESSYSFIGINAIAGMEISSAESIEFKLPGQKPEKVEIRNIDNVPAMLWEFMNKFEVSKASPNGGGLSTGFSEEGAGKFAQGLFGYTTYDAVQFFDTIKLTTHHLPTGQAGSPLKAHSSPLTASIPLMRYRLYQYVIAINHFKDELFICENKVAGVESELEVLESLIRSKDIPAYPFQAKGKESSNMTDQEYKEMVKKGIASSHRGDVFQIVLSRRFEQKFQGDEFNVYRALRNINPSPYLFFFDYGDYKLMGSSPEAQ